MGKACRRRPARGGWSLPGELPGSPLFQTPPCDSFGELLGEMPAPIGNEDDCVSACVSSAAAREQADQRVIRG